MKISAKKRNILIIASLLVLAAGLSLFLATRSSDASGEGSATDSSVVAAHTTATTPTTSTSRTPAKVSGNQVNDSGTAMSDVSGTDSGSSGSSDSGESNPAPGSQSGGGSDPSQYQTIEMKPGNVSFYAHQDNEFHHLVAGLPVEFEVNIQLWIPGNNNQILLINQPTSVYVTYWKSPGGAKQTVELNHWKNDQGSSWWVMSIPALAPGNYQVEVYPGNPTPMTMITVAFTINNN